MKKKFRVQSELLDFETAKKDICQACGAAREIIEEGGFRGTGTAVVEYAPIYSVGPRTETTASGCSNAVAEGRCGLVSIVRKKYGID